MLVPTEKLPVFGSKFENPPVWKVSNGAQITEQLEIHFTVQLISQIVRGKFSQNES